MYVLSARRGSLRQLCAGLALLVSLGPSVFAADDDQFDMGARHYAAARWQLAAEEFRDYLEQSPGSDNASDARFYLAECLVQVGDHRSAHKHLVAFLKNHPDHPLAPHASFRLAESAFLGGRYDAAGPRLEQFVADFPDDTNTPSAWLYLGEIARHQADHERAISLYQQALNQDDVPADIAARCWFGVACAQQPLGHIEQATDAWMKVTSSQSPLADDARLRLAALAVRRQQFSQALELVTAVSSSRTDLLPHAAYWKGRALCGVGQHREAAALLQDASQKSDNEQLTARLLYESGKAWRAAGDPQRATKAWTDISARFPQTDWCDDALAELAIAQLAEDRLHDAVATCQALQAQHASSSRLAEVQRLLAVRLLEAGEYERVADIFGSESGASGRSSDAAYYRALADLGLQNYRRALERIDALEQLGTTPQRAEDLLAARISALAGLRQFEQVKQSADTYLSCYPGGRHAASCQALQVRAMIELGDASEATEGLARLRDLETQSTRPLLADALYDLAKLQERLKQDEAALRSCRELMALPENRHTLDAQQAAARLLEKLGQREEALELLQTLADNNPQYVDHDSALYQWAWILADLKRGDEADQVFQRLYTAHPDSPYWPDATYRLAERAARMNDHVIARQLLNELLACGKNADAQAHALYLHGQLAAQEKDWEQTERWMRRLLDEHPATALHVNAEYWSAEAAYRQGHHEEAEERFRQVAAAASSSDQPWMAMIPLRQAQLLARRQQWDAALEIVDTIDDRFPDFAQQYEVDYLRGRCLMGLARFQEARAAFDGILNSPAKSTETAAMAQWMIGETYMHQRRYDEALRAYHRVELRYAFPRWQAAAALQIGKCHEARSESPEAAAAYGRAAEEYGESSYAAEARRRLEALEKPSTARAARGASR